MPGVPGGDGGRRRRATQRAALAAGLIVAIVAAASPFDTGYYDFGAWAPLALGAIVILVGVLFAGRLRFSRGGALALGGLTLILVMSALSILWAQSRESAWTETNRIAFYCVLLAIGLLAIRTLSAARAVIVLLGLPALLAALVGSVLLLTGQANDWFTLARLNWPVGYINGTAALLMIGVWPCLAAAEYAPRRWMRSAAIGGATAIASFAVMTQARAIVLEVVVCGAIVLLVAPGRSRRALKLLLLVAGVLISLHWTLAPYSDSGTSQTAAIPTSALREAGGAVLIAGLLIGVAHQLISQFAQRLTDARRASVLTLVGRVLAGALVLGIVVGIAVGHSTIGRQYDDFTSNKITSLTSASSSRLLEAGGFRSDLWRVALDEWVDHPAGGVGAGNYDTQYYRLRHNPEYVLDPHSLELQMLAELGIVGLLGLLLFVGATLWGARPRRNTLAGRDPVIRIAAVGAFTAWLVGTSVDWLYDIPGITGLAILAAAVLLAPAPPDPSDPATTEPAALTGARARSQRAIQVTALAILALLAASVGRQFAGTVYANKGASDVSAGHAAAALQDLSTARQLDPYSLDTLYSIAQAYSVLDDYQGAREALVDAQRLEPSNYVPPTRLGDIADLRGYPRLALHYYLIAHALNPLDDDVEYRLTHIRAELAK